MSQSNDNDRPKGRILETSERLSRLKASRTSNPNAKPRLNEFAIRNKWLGSLPKKAGSKAEAIEMLFGDKK